MIMVFNFKLYLLRNVHMTLYFFKYEYEYLNMFHIMKYNSMYKNHVV